MTDLLLREMVKIDMEVDTEEEVSIVDDEDEDDQKEIRERPRRNGLVEQPDDEEQQQEPAQGHEVRHESIIRRALPDPSKVD